MHVHGSVGRVLFSLVLVLGLVLGTVGGLTLGAPGVVVVVLVGGLAGLIRAGILRESPAHDRRATIEGAVVAAALAAVAILLVVGLSTVTGGAMTALAVVGATTTWGMWLLVRLRQSGRTRGGALTQSAGPVSAEVHALPELPRANRFVADRETMPELPGLPDLARLSTPALGSEWLRTTVALDARLDPGGRRGVVERRQATLDELERRDPAGFARWLAGGPVPGSDPAAFVREDPTTRTEAA